MTAVNPGLSGHAEKHLLLEAFEMFTQASSSLESAFAQLQARAQRLTEELEEKNRELERSLAEKEEAENYLKRILERLPCGVFVFDVEGELALCNPLASEVLGLHGRRKPGRIRDRFAVSVSSDGAREVEIPIIAGGKKRVMASSGTPLTDREGKQIGTLHIIRDVTEVKALQEQNKRSERLAAMGEMAVELAHEIRNPLAGIELFASLLEKDLAGNADLKRCAVNIRMGSRSLNNIVSNMLQFANPLTPTISEVNLHRIIEDVLGFTSPIFEQRKIRVEAFLKAESSVVAGDSELLKQVILNLVLNSMNAMPSRGSLTVSTRSVQQIAGVSSAAFEIQIRDTGIGIPPENLARIFDPFFTTNKKGTGLGLSVVHQIVDRHAGTIGVTSEVNIGTLFTVVLPCATAISGAVREGVDARTDSGC